jgi:hypothetical protein
MLLTQVVLRSLTVEEGKVRLSDLDGSGTVVKVSVPRKRNTSNKPFVCQHATSRSAKNVDYCSISQERRLVLTYEA